MRLLPFVRLPLLAPLLLALAGCPGEPNCPGGVCPACPDGGPNACGGCGPLTQRPFSLCGPESRGLNVCVGPDAVQCLNAAAVNPRTVSFEDRVEVVWDAPELQPVRYIVSQAGRRIPTDGGLTAVDFGAPAGSFGNPPQLMASTSRDDGIEVTWTAPTGRLGTSVAYTITSVFDAGGLPDAVEVVDSQSTTGQRLAPTPVRYLLERNGVLLDAGASTSFLDLDAPLGVFTSEPPVIVTPSLRGILQLEAQISGAFAVERGLVSYRAKAVSAGGVESAFSPTQNGHLRVEPDPPAAVTVQWQRSAGSTPDSGFSDLPGITGARTIDRNPVFGQPRWYRARLTLPNVQPLTTEAAVGQVDPLVAVSAGWGHTCGLRSDNKMVCWGDNTSGQAPRTPSTEDYRLISAGRTITCGLLTDGRLNCLGPSFALPPTNPSVDTFVDVETLVVQPGDYYYSSGDAVCARRADAGMYCFSSSMPFPLPPEVEVPHPIRQHNGRCGLITDGGLTCFFETNVRVPPASGLTSLGRAAFFDDTRFPRTDPESCGLAGTSVVCSATAPGPIPSGAFVDVGLGQDFGCARRADGTVACWGGNGSGQVNVPDGGRFVQLSVGRLHVCGVAPDAGGVTCWGDNSTNQRDP